MAAIGMGMIAGAGMIMPVSQTKHTWGRRFNEHSNEIKNILFSLKQPGGKWLCCGNARLSRTSNIKYSNLLLL